MRRGVFALVLASAPFGAFSTLGAGLGCDGETSFVIPAADAGAPSTRYAAACGTWARGYCSFQASCPAYYVRWSDGQCVPRMTLECEVIASDPNVPFDPSRVAGCPEPDAGSCTTGAGDLCLGPGRGPIGAPCLVGEACQTGFCAFTFDAVGQRSSCGACSPLPCGGSCPAGQVCNLGLDGGSSCVRVAAVGEPCLAAADCATYYCDKTGRCGAQALEGEHCDSVDGPPCGTPDTFCDDVTKRCRRYLFAGYGQPCDGSGGDVYQCSGFGTCDYANNVCIPPAADGEFCDDTQGLNCLLPARCISHRCVFSSLSMCAGP